MEDLAAICGQDTLTLRRSLRVLISDKGQRFRAEVGRSGEFKEATWLWIRVDFTTPTTVPQAIK